MISGTPSAGEWLALARRLAAEGRHRAAARAAGRAVRLDPALPPAHHRLGSSLLALGATERAVPALRAAQRLAPEIRYYRYELLDGLGRLEMDGADPEVHRDLLDCLEREGIDPCHVRDLAVRFLLARPRLRHLAAVD